MQSENLKLEKYPQVLLLGNGINRAYEKTAISWGRLIKNVEGEKEFPDDLSLPMPLEVVLRTGDNIDKTLRKECAKLHGCVDSKEMEQILQKILSMGFDHILTTNYSYELEAAAFSCPEISKYKITKCMQHTDEVTAAESRYLLHTYNYVKFQEHANRIWHIHGEARKPDSMILGHYYYGNLLYKYQEFLKKRGNCYYHNQRHQKEQEIKSWIDAFILGDVYILGFGLDFSEMDLWWLLNRKKREKAETGKVYYFAPEEEDFDVKTELLKVYDVQVEHMGYRQKEMKETGNLAYRRFYQDAIKEIERKKSQR